MISCFCRSLSHSCTVIANCYTRVAYLVLDVDVIHVFKGLCVVRV